ncbi:MAG TPA: hypothetical protein ENI23_12565 [bacterium]|nr:hypothetical protein [bacterium]
MDIQNRENLLTACLLNRNMSRWEQRKMVRRYALEEIAACIQANELSYLFGDDLCNLQYRPGGDFVEDVLVQVQKTVISYIDRQVKSAL